MKKGKTTLKTFRVWLELNEPGYCEIQAYDEDWAAKKALVEYKRTIKPTVTYVEACYED